MNTLNGIRPPQLFLFRLTLRMNGKQSLVYSMGESVDDAFTRHLAREVNRSEVTAGLEFIAGDLANPNVHLT